MTTQHSKIGSFSCLFLFSFIADGFAYCRLAFMISLLYFLYNFDFDFWTPSFSILVPRMFKESMSEVIYTVRLKSTMTRSIFLAKISHWSHRQQCRSRVPSNCIIMMLFSVSVGIKLLREPRGTELHSLSLNLYSSPIVWEIPYWVLTLAAKWVTQVRLQ